MKRFLLPGIILLHWSQIGPVDNYVVYNNGNQIGIFSASSVTRLADGSYIHFAPDGCNVGECQLQAWYKGYSSNFSNLQPAPTPVITPTAPVLLGK